MKQLLIVNSAAALNGGKTNPSDLSGMTKGSIGFFHLDDYNTWLEGAPTKNFGIALGCGTQASAFVIPEVDFSSLTVVKSTPQTGVAKVIEFTVPTPTANMDYTAILIKKGVVFRERNTWTSTVTATSSMDASKLAKALADSINNNNSVHNVTAVAQSAKVTLTGAIDTDFEVALTDELSDVTVTEKTAYVKSTGTAADIKELALACAAGKGFNLLAEDGKEIYPGFPEAVEDTNYNVYTLRFKVGRSAAKQVDEQVYQIIHIAVPVGATSLTAIETIFGFGTTPTPSVEDGD